MQISKMTISDLEEIKDILYSDFDNFWTYNVFKQELENSNSIYIIGRAENEVLGFAGFTVILDEADITNIVVKKIHRNKTIGTFLLDNLIKIATEMNLKTITLEVNENNKYAIKLYENFGFENLGIRNKYYNNTDNAIIMTKILNKNSRF